MVGRPLGARLLTLLLMKENKMNAFDLKPFLRSTVGFDEIADLLGSMMTETRKADQYPPYNIERLTEEKYRITVAVAGFTEKDLEITKHKNVLTIDGKINKSEETPERNFLYKGIAERSFQLQFRIADHVNVTAVELENGLLIIDMEREVPEEYKPQNIPIKSAPKSVKTIEGKKN